jgi:hypothetical protein
MTGHTRKTAGPRHVQGLARHNRTLQAISLALPATGGAGRKAGAAPTLASRGPPPRRERQSGCARPQRALQGGSTQRAAAGSSAQRVSRAHGHAAQEIEARSHAGRRQLCPSPPLPLSAAFSMKMYASRVPCAEAVPTPPSPLCTAPGASCSGRSSPRASASRLHDRTAEVAGRQGLRSAGGPHMLGVADAALLTLPVSRRRAGTAASSLPSTATPPTASPASSVRRLSASGLVAKRRIQRPTVRPAVVSTCSRGTTTHEATITDIEADAAREPEGGGSGVVTRGVQAPLSTQLTARRRSPLRAAAVTRASLNWVAPLS